MTSPAAQLRQTAASKAADILARVPPPVRHVFALAEWGTGPVGPVLGPRQVARLLGRAYDDGTKAAPADGPRPVPTGTVQQAALANVQTALDDCDAALAAGNLHGLLTSAGRLAGAADTLHALYNDLAGADGDESSR